jgi:hypothetical protein
MTLSSTEQHHTVGLALTTAQKIEIEARNVEPNMRRLVLLCNTYEECISKAKEPLFWEHDRATADKSQSEVYSSACSHTEDSSSSEDSDEWESDDSSSDAEEPPAYSLYTSPKVPVSVSEYCSTDESDDSDDDFDGDLDDDSYDASHDDPLLCDEKSPIPP